MGLTQKYKQQQQQVRIQTNESNYIKGMYFTDAPLAEGYSRVLVNWDIDPMSGKLIPRKGLKSLGLIKPTESAKRYLNNTKGYNIVVNSKVCYTSDLKDKRKVNKVLQAILYNTDTRSLNIATCDPETIEGNEFDITPFSLTTAAEFTAPEPFIIGKPHIHGVDCLHNNFFKRPVGAFAFGNNYYTFIRHTKHTVTKLELPDGITDYATLAEQYPTGTPGSYYKLPIGSIAYYNTAGVIGIWEKSEEALQFEEFPDTNPKNVLCYTKLGIDIQPDDILLDPNINRTQLQPNKYYVCVIEPQKLNPTEAASWGYNMLAENPYEFTCEETATNTITILGILPYDDTGLPVITPRKNQRITFKAFYRAPKEYHSDTENAKYYTTTKQYVIETETVTDENSGEFYTVEIKRNPKDSSELPTSLTNYKYGDWWYVEDIKTYYMVMPTTNNSKQLDVFGTSKPAASEKLGPTNDTGDDEIRIHWQIRQAGASDWATLENKKVHLKDYIVDGVLQPFTISTTLSQSEALIRLHITDPVDEISNEEYVLATNMIGVSAVSDDLANTLNLNAKVFDLKQCTGMCEWGQRLVVWGVPDALNTLFISDVNNPTFFPYPNNIDIFTDPIISVHNYGNELLVLTTSALYRLTWDAEGTGWTHTLVQQNLHVTESDTFMSCVIKNMFFFKSGEYYYMMVPKSSATVRGETTIAPISKSIEGLLDNFHTEVANLAKVISDTQSDFTPRLVNYFSYVDGNKVVVNYVYDSSISTTPETEGFEGAYRYVQLIYDTELRTWTMKMFSTAHMLYASHIDAVQQNRFIDLVPTTVDPNQLYIQYYKFEGYNDISVQRIIENDIVVYLQAIIKNYQYLDTGNREINTELKKRFREFQFKIKNNTATNLGFYTSFLIDGSVRRDLQKYQPRLLLDEATGEATVVVERVLDPDTMSYKTTRIERIIIPERMLQDEGVLTPTTLAEETDADRWILNQSAFPGRTLCKIRMPISGKGLSPRVILLSTNEQNFEILGHCWVYRTMHSR